MSLLKIQPDKILNLTEIDASALLQLENLTTDYVAYKIKTTAPKNYQVRPSSGVIAPNHKQEITIRLQLHNSVENYSSPDRFLIQAVVFTDELVDEALPKDFWNNVNRASIQDQRLAVTIPKSVRESVSNGPPSRGTGSISGGPAAFGTANTADFQKPTAATGVNDDNLSNLITSDIYKKLNDSNDDSAAKYNEVLQYCLAVEKQKTQLAKENELLQEQLNYHKSLLNMSKQNPSGALNNPMNSKGFSSLESDSRNKLSSILFSHDYKLWHIVSVVISAILVLKLFNKLTNLIAP